MIAKSPHTFLCTNGECLCELTMSVSKEDFDRRFYFGKIVMPCPICASEMYEVKQQMTEQKKYIVDADTISAFEDYFLALYSGDGNKTRLLQLWQSNMSVARSEPLGPTLYTAGMVKNRMEHERRRVLDAFKVALKNSGYTGNHNAECDVMIIDTKGGGCRPASLIEHTLIKTIESLRTERAAVMRR